jgi:NitT/TauT family transport system substrate-binding protein
MCVTLTAAALLTLSACSGGGTADDANAPEAPGGATGGDGELTPITMGVLPIVPSAALQLGIDEGIFEEHGFDVTLETGQGGAALLPAVVSGQMQFAISNPLSIMLAQGEGLDVRLITGYSHSLKEGDDITSVWAPADSGITSPKDLEGRTVAVNTLRTMGEVSIKKIVSEDGGDPNGIEFVELGFPDMPAALSAGNIDAAWVPEPFQTILKDGGNQLISYNYQETMPGVPTMSVITAGTLAEQDPEMVDEFVAAVDEITAFAQENPDKVRETLTTFLEMDEALAQKVLIEDFGAEMDGEAMQSLADLSLEYGLLSEPVDMEKLMP